MFVLKHTKLLIVSSLSWSCKQSRYFTFWPKCFGRNAHTHTHTQQEGDGKRKATQIEHQSRWSGESCQKSKSNSHGLTAILVSDRFCIDIWLKALPQRPPIRKHMELTIPILSKSFSRSQYQRLKLTTPVQSEYTADTHRKYVRDKQSFKICLLFVWWFVCLLVYKTQKHNLPID